MKNEYFKYTLAFLCLILTTLQLKSQDTLIIINDTIDRPKVNVESKRWNIEVGPNGVNVIRKDSIKKKVINRFLLLDVGFSGYLYNGSFDLPASDDRLDLRNGKSRNIILHLFQQRYLFADNKMNLSWGMIMDFSKYRFVNHISLIPDSIPIATFETGQTYRRNTLKAVYLGVPIMIGYDSKPSQLTRSFHAKVGFFMEMLLSSKQKQIVKITDRRKTKDDFNLSRFKYGIRGELGYSLMNFYVQYSFSSLFKDNQGPNLHPIQFGVILVPF